MMSCLTMMASAKQQTLWQLKWTKHGKSRRLQVDLYHYKYSKEAPGKRIEDLYVVCGQAHKSICWIYNHEKQVDLFTHLLRREPKRKGGQEVTRFEKGDRDALIEIREMSLTSQCRCVFLLFSQVCQKAKLPRPSL